MSSFSTSPGRTEFQDNYRMSAIARPIKINDTPGNSGAKPESSLQNERLPLIHGKPNRQYVMVRIKFGGALMPAFNKRLNEPEINTLIDYIASK